MSRRCLAIAVVFLPFTASADLDTIIPMPKQMRAIGDPAPVAGFRIAADRSERGRIAAGEINQRIAALGGEPLPVIDLEGRLPRGRLIVVATCGNERLRVSDYDLKVTGQDPGPQGYVIAPRGQGDDFKLFLVGSDSMGMLYAAVTCRQLIVQRDAGLVLLPADIRDWPDYKHRAHGIAFAEHLRRQWYRFLRPSAKADPKKVQAGAGDYVEHQKRYFDFMLRAKINMGWNSTNVKPGDAPDGTDVVRSALREVHDYGLARGIECIAGDTSAIGKHPRDKDNPDFKDVVRHRSHNRYFCWSRLEYHHRRAERAAKWLSDCGYRGYYLHATDGGGWQNPALWNDRCALCRKTYGDDHARADAAVFRTYYDAIKKRIPQAKFLAVVYPYTGRYLDPEWVYDQAAATMGSGAPARRLAESTMEKLTRFLRRLDSLLPQDIYVCIRESERRHLDLARAAWGKRPFYVYYEYAFWKGWRPYFITTPLWTKSLYYPEYDDILFSPLGAWSEMTQLLGVECSWHVNRPGSADFDSQRWRDMGTALAPPAERESFALRGSRFLFGDTAGPMIAPVYAENISYMFIAQPDEVMKRLRIADPAKTMAEQAEAAGRAAESLDRLWERHQASPVLRGDSHGYFLNLYRATHGAHILAAHRGHMLAAEAAVRRGDHAGVERHLQAAREHIARSEPLWQTIQKRTPWDQCFAFYVRPTSRTGRVARVDLGKLSEEVEDLWQRRGKLIAAYTIPRWFDRSCRTREVVALPADGPMTIDGQLDEPGWARAWPIQHFLDYRTLRIEGLETQARLLYGPEALYVAFECFDPDPSQIPLVMAGRDEHRRCDSVEVLLSPRAGSSEFIHYIVDSKGTVFDARAAKTDGITKYSQRWNGAARIAAQRGRDRWTVEMAIPAGDLGLSPARGRSCRLLLCRNIVHTRAAGEEESNAIVFLDGSGFRTPGKFAKVRFESGSARPSEPQVGLTLRPISFRHVTTGDGAGTRIDAGLHIETDTYLHDVQVAVALSDGVAPLGEKALGEAKLVRLMWRPQQPFFVLVRQEVPGMVCTFRLKCREGEWSFTRRIGAPKRAAVPDATLYATGVDGRPQTALAYPVHFSSVDPKTIDLAEGTIEFWFQPRWDPTLRASGPRDSLAHAFFNMGPIRPDHPHLSNRDSLTLSHQGYGTLHAILTNNHYESRTVASSTSQWRQGEWRHVALQWKLDDAGKTGMALFVDGKLASADCRGSNRSPNDKPLTVHPLGLPIQIGAMNTGFRPADGAIDELRISSVRRYSDPFGPAKRFEPDAHTLALFHFDGSLRSMAPAGPVAVAGPAQ